MKNKEFKKRTAIALTMMLLVTQSMPLQAEEGGWGQNVAVEEYEGISSVEMGEVTTPSVLQIQQVTTSATLEFSFDNYKDGEEVVLDEVSEKEARLVGKASIIKDDERGKVLNLQADGGLELPADLFQNINGDDGFTISFDVKINPSTEKFSRMFDSSCYPFKKGNTGNGWILAR